MNGPEVLTLLRTQLAKRIAAHDSAAFEPLSISPLLASAALQKAIRRDRAGVALGAAATLLRDAPDRFWRRLVGISFEDVGIASLETIGLVTAAVGSKRLRFDLGGEWPVASLLVQELAGSLKCRSSDDLLMNAQTHPAYAAARSDFAELPVTALLSSVQSERPIIERGLALWYAMGSDRPSGELQMRPGGGSAVFDWLADTSLPHSVVEIARQGFVKGAGMLAAFTVLLSGEIARDTPSIQSDDLPPEQMIGEVPSWCLDMYSREGRAALQLFLQGDSRTARWVRSHTPPSLRPKFLGELVFRVEGGLLSRRLHWQLAAELREQYELECLGVEPAAAAEALALMREDLPALNKARAASYGGAAHVR